MLFCWELDGDPHHRAALFLRPSTTLDLGIEWSFSRAAKRIAQLLLQVAGSKKKEQGDTIRRRQSRAIQQATTKKKRRNKKEIVYSRAGNRTLVPRVTGEDTSHYTTPEERIVAEPEGVRTLATFVTRT